VPRLRQRSRRHNHRAGYCAERGDPRTRDVKRRSRCVVRHRSPAQIGVSASRRPPIPLPDPPVRACWQRRCVLPEHRPAWAPQPVAFCSAARIVACSSRLAASAAASAEFLSWAAAGSSACCFAAAVRFCAASAAVPFRSSAAVRASSTSRSVTARASFWSSIALSRLAFSSSSACPWFWVAVASSWAAWRGASLR
jgi:hypothetical protein